MLDNTLSVDYIGSDFSNTVDFDELLNKKRKKSQEIEYISEEADDGIFDFGKSINKIA